MSLEATEKHTLFPDRAWPDPDELIHGLKCALEAQQQGAHNGKRPFAAVLLGPDRQTVLLRQFSLSHVQHAESEICRSAATQFAPEFLWTCYLFSTWEPCAMCSGVMYWSNIGTLIYAASEKALQVVVGADNPENFTMDLSCRKVLGSGQKDIRVIGPINGAKTDKSGITVDWQSKICEHAWDSYWQESRGLRGTTWASHSKGNLA